MGGDAAGLSGAMSSGIGGLRCTVDFARTGKQLGMLWAPDSGNNASGWGNVGVPLACVVNGDGPTVLVMAGNHGDEYESQLALHRLIGDIEPADVAGRLIIIPTLSVPAASASARLWPDGTNFNRAFPGEAAGRASAQLAWHLSGVLFPLADVVCDFHTGGRSLAFLPMASLHLVDEPHQREQMVRAAIAMGTGRVLAYVDTNGGGLLPGNAEAQGKIVVTAELGGGGVVTAGALDATTRYVANVLRHVGVLPGGRHGGGEPAPVPTTVLRSTAAEDYVLAPASGLYEPLVELGAPVSAGDVLGRVHPLGEWSHAAVPVVAETSGVLVAMRAITTTRPGDCVGLVGQESSAEDLIKAEATSD